MNPVNYLTNMTGSKKRRFNGLGHEGPMLWNKNRHSGVGFTG